MCMIAYRPVVSGKSGSNIPTNVIDTAMARHPDGFGVAWREWDEDGHPSIHSLKFGPQQRKAFRKALKRVDRARGVEYVAHFRWATHGPKAASHSHPYEYADEVEGKVLVFHNGIIDIATTKAESDTEVFVRDVLANMPTAWWRNPALTYLVGEAIGWSRIVLMTATETINLQENDGEWDSGLWYSSNHKPTVATKYTSAYTHYGWDAEKRAYTPHPTVVTADAATRGKSAEESYKVLTDGATTQTTPASRALTVVQSAMAQEDTDTFAYGDEAVGLIARDIDRPQKFRHGGHKLSCLKDIRRDVDGDYPEGVICDECFTTGDAYAIDGQVYIDMAHRVGAGSPDNVGENEEWADESALYDLPDSPIHRLSKADKRRARLRGNVATVLN